MSRRARSAPYDDRRVILQIVLAVHDHELSFGQSREDLDRRADLVADDDGGSAQTLSASVDVGGHAPGDLDGDGAVGGGDLAVMLLDFGPCAGCPGDLDGNGSIDGGDIAYLLLLFG